MLKKRIENHPQTPPAKAKKYQVKPFKPQAYKYYIEQNLQNLEVELEQRLQRQFNLELELEFYDVTEPDLKDQIRLKLRQKESNYLRLKRLKLTINDVIQLKTIGAGEFGKVDLVRSKSKDPSKGALFAMKTMKKS